MMRKMLLTTHWTAEEVQLVLEFLEELREIVRSGYSEELNALYESYRTEASTRTENLDLFNDDIPF